MVMRHYFRSEEGGERSVCLTFAFFFLLLAMVALVIREDYLEFGLEPGGYEGMGRGDAGRWPRAPHSWPLAPPRAGRRQQQPGERPEAAGLGVDVSWHQDGKWDLGNRVWEMGFGKQGLGNGASPLCNPRERKDHRVPWGSVGMGPTSVPLLSPCSLRRVPLAKLAFKLGLVALCSFLGACLTFPGLRLAQTHLDALRMAADKPLTQLGETWGREGREGGLGGGPDPLALW